MGAQVQQLKKERRLLVFACSTLALLVFVAGIFAFVQRGVAVENEKKAIEAMRLNIELAECEEKQRMLIEKLKNTDAQLQSLNEQLAKANTKIKSARALARKQAEEAAEEAKQ